MTKKILIFIGLLIISFLVYSFLFKKSIFAPGQNSDVVLVNNPQEYMVGNDSDEHGCIGSAGYTWCESKGKCLRLWEESCNSK